MDDIWITYTPIIGVVADLNGSTGRSDNRGAEGPVGTGLDDFTLRIIQRADDDHD